MPEETSDTEIIPLKNNPSVKGWDLELRRVLHGDRYHDINRIGSTQEYIESILDESKDKALAEHALAEALSAIVAGWHPSKAEDGGYTYRMLELIIAFTPMGAFAKLLDAVKDEKIIVRKSLVESELKAASDIVMKILVAMRRYYPAPPSSRSGDLAFDEYVRLLESFTQQPSYSGYAVVTLIELGVWRIEDERIEHILNRDAGSLHTILNFILSSKRRRKYLTRDLQSMYESFRDPKVLELFKKHLTLRGFQSKSGEHGIELVSPGGETIKLSIQDSDFERYVIPVRWTMELSDVKERLQRGTL